MTATNLILLILLLILYWMGRKALDKLVLKIALEKRVPAARSHYVSGVLKIGWLLLAINAFALIAGFKFTDMGIWVSSMFAVMGVALFAQWSILSNVSASIFIFFFFPFRPGDWVKIVDGENSIEGAIREITLFHVILNGEGGIIHTYPNSLVFQKAISIQKEGGAVTIKKNTDTQTES